MSVDDNPGDDAPAPAALADNVVPFRPERSSPAASPRCDESRDDDELLQHATNTIAKWNAASDPPSMTEVQNLFHELICNGGSAMLRDRVVSAIVSTFGDGFGGRRALGKAWGDIAKQVATERSQAARGVEDGDGDKPLTAEQKTALRAELWPRIRELAEAPDLMDRVVHQVQEMGVVNEPELIQLSYVAGTSRVLDKPINPAVKGASSAGKTFTTTRTLDLIGPDYVNYLTSSSALSLVYDDRPLAHTVLVVFEANQLQADENSTYAMLLRSLVSEGRIVHQTTVEDPDFRTGRRVERIVREGPISLFITTTGDLHAEQETRMLPFHVSESQEQTRGVIDSLASRVAGDAAAPSDLSAWHDLQRWIAYGPNDAIIPFARQIASKIPPAMVRFRRDVGSLFSFIKASAILHQAQRQKDSQGRVIATIADYALAYPIFSRIMAQSSGQRVSDAVRSVVDLIAERAGPAPAKAKKGQFLRIEGTGAANEVTISSEQIGIALGVNKSAAYRALKTAIDRGFLVNNETRQHKPFRLVVGRRVDDLDVELLPHPDTLVGEGRSA